MTTYIEGIIDNFNGIIIIVYTGKLESLKRNKMNTKYTLQLLVNRDEFNDACLCKLIMLSKSDWPVSHQIEIFSQCSWSFGGDFGS